MVLAPIKVVDIELTQPITTIEGLDGYITLQGLIRLHGVPLGYVKAPITMGRCEPATLSKLILEQHSYSIIRHLVANGLAASLPPEKLQLENLFEVPPPQLSRELPLVTVAVCTRDRAADLAFCLDALIQLDYPNLDLLVVDNAPTSDATQKLVQTYPTVRYVCEPRPGLDWARNRAILEAKGEIIAYTDDDVVVDRGWVKAIVQVFAENPEVSAMTGLVVPYELETEAQVLFETYGGFGRGFQRKWSRVEKGNKMPLGLLGTGQFGAGANMAYRRRVFDEIGYFDLAMDVGTVTNGGGDLEMYFRVLKEGHTLVYEPSAIVRHRHRQDYAKLRTQITNNGIGLYSYFACGIIRYPEELLKFLVFGIWWLGWWHIQRLLFSFIHPKRFPRDLILAELRGLFQSFGRYQRAAQTAKEIAANFPDLPLPPPRQILGWQEPAFPRKSGESVQMVELSQPMQLPTGVASYEGVRVIVTFQQKPIGSVYIRNNYQPVSQRRLVEAIANLLSLEILQATYNLSKDLCWSKLSSSLAGRFVCDELPKAVVEHLPDDVPVSIVITTYDRPDDLHRCLTHVTAQATQRPVQIIVVDNHPGSGLTPTIVEQFTGVTLLSEPRLGSSYARNKGILASIGEIIITLDDDVTVSEKWLENLLSPFTRHDIAAVTGKLLPLELETASQRLFEIYQETDPGFDHFEVDSNWFEACPYRTIPTWHLGSCANAAFRSSLFKHPQIGLLEESLGTGTPAGSGEDFYQFYKLLKAGYKLLYQPSAYAMHKHCRDMSDFRSQVFNHSKGHTAYQLTTLVQDRDMRVFARLLVGLPLEHFYRIYYRLRGWNWYPIWLSLLVLSGNLLGLLAFLHSRLRVFWIGRSASSNLVFQTVMLDATRNEEEIQPVKSNQLVSAQGD